MENRTFFFRDDLYSLFEMYKRIPKENFIDLINTYSGEDFKTKESAFNWFMQNYDQEEQIQVITPCFNSYGKKGDMISVQLYSLNSLDLGLESEVEKEIISSLKGKLLNEIPLIGSFLSEPCYLEDVKIDNVNQFVDYKFKFETASYKSVDGNPVKEINNNYIEIRHYTKKNIVAALENKKTDQKTIIKLLYSLPAYIGLKQEKTQFTIIPPNFHEIELNPSQLIFLKTFMNAKLQSGGFDVDGEKGVTVKVYGSSLDFETESVFYNDTKKRGKFKEVSFYWVDYIVTIRKNGEITSSNYASEDTLDRIINLVWKINSYKDFLIPMEEIIEKYCRMLNPAAVSSAIQRKGHSIIEDLKRLISDIAKTYKKSVLLSNIYLAIVLNIIIKLSTKQADRTLSTTIELSEYNELYNFLKTYLLNVNKIELNSQVANKIISNLDAIIQNANSEKELIDYYQNNY